MSVLSRVKRFFANTIHGYGEVFRHRYVDFEVVSRKLMCDIRAFGKEIMDLPEDSDIYEVPQESSNESENEHILQSPSSIKSLKSTRTTATFDVPDFGSDLDLELDSIDTNETLFGCSDDDESVKKKTGYEYDSDFEPEVSEASKKRKNKPQVKWNGKRFKRVYTVERFIDFTKGQTRVNKRLQIVDETICGIIEKVLSEKKPVKDGEVFYKCARNWEGIILPGLVVTTQGFFYVCCDQGIFMKPVSQKDRFLYHDSMRIHAPRIVFSTFTKGHPGLNGESEESFYFTSRNGSKHQIGIDNLICNRGAKNPKGRSNV